MELVKEIVEKKKEEVDNGETSDENCVNENVVEIKEESESQFFQESQDEVTESQEGALMLEIMKNAKMRSIEMACKTVEEVTNKKYDNESTLCLDEYRRSRGESCVCGSFAQPSVLKFKRLSPMAYSPFKGSRHAAGFDLRSAYDYEVLPHDRQLVKTDLSIELPSGTYGRLAPRSGLAWKKFIDVGAGVIDYDYRGNVCVILYNHSNETFSVKAGDRIAQLICERIAYPILCDITKNTDDNDDNDDDDDNNEKRRNDELGQKKYLSERGQNGFGSTGV